MNVHNNARLTPPGRGLRQGRQRRASERTERPITGRADNSYFPDFFSMKGGGGSGAGAKVGGGPGFHEMFTGSTCKPRSLWRIWNASRPSCAGEPAP